MLQQKGKVWSLVNASSATDFPICFLKYVVFPDTVVLLSLDAFGNCSFIHSFINFLVSA